MSLVLAWASLIVLIIFFVFAGIPEHLERIEKEQQRRKPKQGNKR